jgi:2-dehydro-3-deoxyphosphogluconate aldolase / (4S)-4-hydroxy-2-oxoglutarate aldolase
MSVPSHPDFLARLRARPLLAILRDAPPDALPELARCLRTAEIAFVEVALNTPDALEQIRILKDLLQGEVEVGAGTVLSKTAAEAAHWAGASFLVSPCLVPEVQAYARLHSLPTFPGAFTPQEIWNAHQAGATMVKLFPAKAAGGPGYVKELRGPFRDIPILACGGVSAATARDYLDAGAQALAFGGSIFSPARLKARDFEGVLSDLVALSKAVTTV